MCVYGCVCIFVTLQTRPSMTEFSRLTILSLKHSVNNLLTIELVSTTLICVNSLVVCDF